MKRILILVAMLSMLLCAFGTAHAVFGVNDDVAARDIVIPIVCATDASNGLNTNWAIAEVTGLGTIDLSGNIAYADVQLKNVKSALVHDFTYAWTPHDVVVDNCKALTSGLSPAEKTAMTVTVDGVNYYAGYIFAHSFPGPGPIFTTVFERFVSWVYLVDLSKGFASGFNGISLEFGGTATGTNLAEAAGTQAITAFTLYPRYFLLNDTALFPDTFNWWMFLLGRNQYSTPNVTSVRNLEGIICDEEENCQSTTIPIPNELNIVSVAPILPGAPLHPAGFPKGGFAVLNIVEHGNALVLGGFTIHGSRNVTTSLPLALSNWYSVFGWSYERAEDSSATLSWDVVHPMFRDWCHLANGDAYITSVLNSPAGCNVTVP